MFQRAGLLILVCLAFCATFAVAAELYVAAASNLTFAMPEIVAEFEKDSAHEIKVSFGSSGNFYSQISNGAPFDLFLSADMEYPRKLVENGKAQSDSLFAYSRGQIVLWVPHDSPLDIDRLGMKVLTAPAVHKIALANPRHAPYGQAALQALRHFELYDPVADKLVYGENISQAAQFVQLGAADLGVLALSLAVASPLEGKGRYWIIPPDSYSSIEQGAVILQAASAKGKLQAAREFWRWLQSPEAIAILDRHGLARDSMDDAD
ncbi:MAG: molybdate ABC transporter substrate-binding protein [Acidobacteriota bacterium]